MNLEHSGYLWFLFLIPCFICYSLISLKQTNDWLYRFAHVKKSYVPRILATLFLSLSMACLVFSLAGPGIRYTKVMFNRSGIDVVIGIDVSKSMLAEDEGIPEEGRRLFVIPNRLNRARYCALNIMSALKGERVGVFMFASKGMSIVPLTNDYGYCQYILKHVSDATIATPGSDLGQAVATGVSMFEGSSRKTVKAIVLISDGEDISDDKYRMYDAAQDAETKGIAVYTIGVGMPQGVMIPIRDSTGEAIEGYYQDEDGSYLKTRLDQDTLSSISTITGGRYFRAHDERSSDGIVESMLKRARTIEYTKSVEPAWFDLSPVLLCASLLFFIVGILAGR